MLQSLGRKQAFSSEINIDFYGDGNTRYDRVVSVS